LDAEQFEVTRNAGTERPGSGKYANNHADGLYTCICCNTFLFDSKTKFESGTGWPSFYQTIAKENVFVTQDNSHGCNVTRFYAHVATGISACFRRRPSATHLRYCMNSAAMNFVARAKPLSK